MQVLTLIGALGADAQLKTENGREYIQFSVADNNRWTARDGQVKEETNWVACFMNGRNENLLPYLVKGAKVCVMGRMGTRVYSSEKLRRMVAGVDINVDRLELIGGRPDSVPRMLFDENGVGHQVSKFFHVEKVEGCILTDGTGRWFEVDQNGWVNPKAVGETSESGQQDSAQEENAGSESVG